jgi:hypothetical protein
MKYSNTSGVVRYSGGTIVLGRGMSADDDHPLVLERPDLFVDEAPPAQLRGPGASRRPADGPKVERATRAPGERRGGTSRG